MTDIVTPEFNSVHMYTSKKLNAVGMVITEQISTVPMALLLPFSIYHPGLKSRVSRLGVPIGT